METARALGCGRVMAKGTSPARSPGCCATRASGYGKKTTALGTGSGGRANRLIM